MPEPPVTISLLCYLTLSSCIPRKAGLPLDRDLPDLRMNDDNVFVPRYVSLPSDLGALEQT